MATQIGLTFDCADPTKLAEFWKLALGYEDQPPPPPFKTRAEWAASFGPDDDDGDGAWLHDPAGAGPTLSLLQVPEPKVAKNRLHIDIRVSKQGLPEQRWTLVTGMVERLTAAGATVVEEYPEHHVVMADPEGNEFCVC